jgi:hypothetical protein
MKELIKNELREVDGGFIIWPVVCGAMLISLFSEVVGDWENFERGLTGQPYCK